MYTAQPKNMLIMNILEILKKHSDEEHRLNQKEIIDLLDSEYDMKVDRKAINREGAGRSKERIRGGQDNERKIDWKARERFPRQP